MHYQNEMVIIFSSLYIRLRFFGLQICELLFDNIALLTCYRFAGCFQTDSMQRVTHVFILCFSSMCTKLLERSRMFRNARV